MSLVRTATLLLTLTVAAVCLWGVADATGRQIDCRRVRCRCPLCANPVTPPGQCCPSCENSSCIFGGCVNFLSNGQPQWQPNPCVLCSCINNQTICASIGCRPLEKEDCFGFPVVTKPGECCPSCNFSIPKRRCAAVPRVFSRKNITVTEEDQFGSTRSCTRQVVERTCDKVGFRAYGKKFHCAALRRKRRVRFRDNCPLCSGFFTDVVWCRPVRDDTIVVGCDLVV